jgi:hypothetical protein
VAVVGWPSCTKGEGVSPPQTMAAEGAGPSPCTREGVVLPTPMVWVHSMPLHPPATHLAMVAQGKGAGAAGAGVGRGAAGVEEGVMGAGVVRGVGVTGQKRGGTETYQ